MKIYSLIVRLQQTHLLKQTYSVTERALSTPFKIYNRRKSTLFVLPLSLSVSMDSSCKNQNEHTTRKKYSIKIQEQKERFLKMNLEEKREIYKCGKKYKTLKDVQTWQSYFLENKDILVKKIAKKKYGRKDIEKREPRPDLNKKVSIWRGDITTLEIDAIVNAANESLLGGGGVDGAIHRGAGKKLLEECTTLNGCKTGQAKITGGYKLPAKYVIHTVGPIGERKNLLKSSYENCLKLVKENNLVSVAFPCISTGIYGYSSENAAPVAIETVRNWLEEDEIGQKIERVVFCLFLPKDVEIYEELMQYYFPISSGDDDSYETEEVNALKESGDEDTTKSKKLKKEDVNVDKFLASDASTCNIDLGNKDSDIMETDSCSRSDDICSNPDSKDKITEKSEVGKNSENKSSESEMELDLENQSQRDTKMEVKNDSEINKSTEKVMEVKNDSEINNSTEKVMEVSHVSDSTSKTEDTKSPSKPITRKDVKEATGN